MPVTLYTTPGCPQCRITARHLDLHNVPYTTRDLATDPDARTTYIRDQLGHTAAPVIVITTDDGEPTTHWSGYRPDRLNQLTSKLPNPPAGLSLPSNEAAIPELSRPEVCLPR